MDKLRAFQIKIEEQGRDLGHARYDKQITKAQKKGREDQTTYGRKKLAEAFPELTEGFTLALESKTRPSIPVKLVKGFVDPETLSFLTLKRIMARLTSARSMTSVAMRIGEAIELEVLWNSLNEEAQKHYESIMRKDKGANERERTQTLNYVNKEHGELHKSWEDDQKLKVGLFCIDTLLVHSDWLEVIPPQKKGGHKALAPTASMRKWIEENKAKYRDLSPMYLPMITKPRDWNIRNIKSGCYLTDAQESLPLIKRQIPEQRDLVYKKNPEKVFKALNLIQSTAWRIRKPVLDLLNTMIDKKDELGLPPKKFVPQKDIKISDEMNYWKKKEVDKKNKAYESLRVNMATNLQTAEQFKDFEKIYIPYQLDSRGRVYAVPSLNPQGQDYIKALLEFSEPKPLGKHGLFWLHLHAAGCFGIDKVSFRERYYWVNDNIEEILMSADDPIKNLFWTKADKPFLFYAVCLELKGYVEQGDDYQSRMPIAFDGTCSGLQHLGAAFRCSDTAKSVNLLPPNEVEDSPEDVYQEVSDIVTDILLKNDDVFAKTWLDYANGRLSRSDLKTCVMTYSYGSKASGFQDQLYTGVIKPALEEGNFKLPDGDKYGHKCARYLAEIVEFVIKNKVVKAEEAMNWMQDSAGLIASNNKPIKWTTPLDFPVLQLYPKTELKTINTRLSGGRYQISYRKELDKINTRKMRNAISPNVVHSLDSTHLMMTVLEANKEYGLTDFCLIHDSFGVHAGDSQEFFILIRKTFIDLYEQPIFEKLKLEFDAQMTPSKRKKAPLLPACGDFDLNEVKEALYAFS
ncbi:DNA-directed RNA polymerase [Pleionea sp. CnH1-48]|uniref:DNA-directed RNA polymerase n=1 Tax=Pleionea sp. CnH1-48 TaxID=2954494 RepID=UPI0020970D57|nr:DNA-directed RNA polymerase [Pleionea sp. CnH1-48]MCO7225276.1 hypothetical protein [Pleionea sp. CnH1-48]